MCNSLDFLGSGWRRRFSYLSQFLLFLLLFIRFFLDIQVWSLWILIRILPVTILCLTAIVLLFEYLGHYYGWKCYGKSVKKGFSFCFIGRFPCIIIWYCLPWGCVLVFSLIGIPLSIHIIVLEIINFLWWVVPWIFVGVLTSSFRFGTPSKWGWESGVLWPGLIFLPFSFFRGLVMGSLTCLGIICYKRHI